MDYPRLLCLSDIKLQTVKLVPTDQPAQNILPPRQFCSLQGWQVKCPSNVAISFFTLSLTLLWEMFIAQQLMSLVLRNAIDIHVLTATNLSEADWNIQHAFWIWVYNDYFASLKMPLMSVFGVRNALLDVNKPKTSISASAGVFDDNFSYFSSKPYVVTPNQDGSDEGSQHMFLCKSNKSFP